MSVVSEDFKWLGRNQAKCVAFWKMIYPMRRLNSMRAYGGCIAFSYEENAHLGEVVFVQDTIDQWQEPAAAIFDSITEETPAPAPRPVPNKCKAEDWLVLPPQIEPHECQFSLRGVYYDAKSQEVVRKVAEVRALMVRRLLRWPMCPQWDVAYAIDANKVGPHDWEVMMYCPHCRGERPYDRQESVPF